MLIYINANDERQTGQHFLRFMLLMTLTTVQTDP